MHALLAAVAATIQSVSPLEETDASFRTRSPFLSLPKPALLLVPAAFGAAARTIRNRDPFHAPLLRLRFIGGGVKSGVGGHQTRQPPQALLMHFDRPQQQVRIRRSLLQDLLSGDDLVFGFLDFDQLGELGGLGGLAFANDLGGGFQQTDQLWQACVSPPKRRCLVCRITCSTPVIMVSKYCRYPCKAACSSTSARRLRPPPTSTEKRLAGAHPARRGQQLAVGPLEFLPALPSPAAARAPDLDQPMLHTAPAIAQLVSQRAVAPVADVGHHQQPQDDFRRGARPAPLAALRPAPCECLLHWLD